MATYAYKDFNIVDHACGINHGLYGDKKEGLAFYGENGTMVLTRAGWGSDSGCIEQQSAYGGGTFQKGEGKDYIIMLATCYLV